MLALALHNVTTFDSVHLITNNNSARASSDATAAAIHTRKENIATPMTSHLSITLPCNKLLQSSSASSYNITVVYMDDFSSVKRCFLGIISQGKVGCNVPSSLARCNSVVSSSSTSSNDDESEDSVGKAASNKSNDSKTALPCGKILQIDDDLLFAMIKKA